MTVTMNPTENGRKERRCLATEIDRFDRMIDGLDKAIVETVADAMKEAMGPAVEAAFKSTITELLSNPQILTLLSNLQPQAAATPSNQHVPEPATSNDQSVPAVPPKLTLLQRLRQKASSVVQSTRKGLMAAVIFVTSPVRQFVTATSATCRQINKVWNLRKPLLVAGAVGIVVGVVASASAPWLSGALAGTGAAVSALLVQIAAWGRKLLFKFAT